MGVDIDDSHLILKLPKWFRLLKRNCFAIAIKPLFQAKEALRKLIKEHEREDRPGTPQESPGPTDCLAPQEVPIFSVCDYY